MDNPLKLTPWHRLALAYAPSALRSRQEALFAMDAICGDICDTTSEMLIGQMRYTWWRDVMTGTPPDRRSGHPLLALITAIDDFDCDALVPVIDAWEGYVVDAGGEEGGVHARNRGEAMASALRAIGVTEASPLLDDFFGCYALWDDIRTGRYDGEAATTAKAALASQLEPVTDWKPDRSLRMMAIIRDMIVRDALHGGWDKPVLRPSMAARMVFRGLTG